MVAADVTFPLIVFEPDDRSVRLIASRTDAEEQLEEIDVSNGEFLAWDATGRACVIGVGPRPDWFLVELDDTGRAADVWAALESAARFSSVQPSGVGRTSPLVECAQEIAADQRANDSKGLIGKVRALVAARRRQR